MNIHYYCILNLFSSHIYLRTVKMLLKDICLHHARTDFQSEYKGLQQWVITTFSRIQMKSYAIIKP